ncbi:hypothetical protein SASPL_115232 [Salvia splendens]|uniref:Uncharacterized protein n=1 Tax=Salvia splendens TaxID=180675 RepID=A0A8X9A136_SALSN|nr:uncharacterized protein LOC121803325 [Salvia splendens]KAG6424812.1 hypothetical protein SASPL_115232 [Salvia splendens]
MVSLEPLTDPTPVPARISFSADFLDDANFISISPKDRDQKDTPTRTAADFEFLSGDANPNMITADELFSEGKLLPFWQSQPLHKLNLKTTDSDAPPPQQTVNADDDQRRISWFLDDDPSPRPPKCTVLWKELLRLKKQRSSTLSPSLSSSSSSSSSSSAEEERKKGGNNKAASKVKKGLERTRSVNIRIRPMINVPICTAARSTALPPLFPARRGGKLEG